MTATHDAASQEATFTYTLSGVVHHVCFQDGVSIGAKCDHAKQAGIAGIAIWRLGGEKTDIWDAIRARR